MYADLQTTLDQVEGYKGRVCDTTTHYASQTAQGEVLGTAVLAAVLL